MLIHYYEIPNCIPDTINNMPVIVAPMNTPPALLSSYGFQRQPDGRDVHFLTQTEYQYITSHDPSTPQVTFSMPTSTQHPDQTNPTAKKLCWITLALMIFSLIPSFGIYSSSSVNNGSGSVYSMISGICGLAIWVLLIILRVKYPHNTFGKVLFRVWVTLFILTIILIAIIFAACAIACRDCKY